MNIFNIEYFLPVLVRVSGLFLFTPFFNGKMIPMLVKVGASIGLSFIVFSVMKWDVVLPDSSVGYSMLLINESMVGFVMGTFLGVLFAGVQAAGNIIGYQIGFSMVSSYDPNFGQMEVISQLKSLLAMTLFILMNGHHKLIEAMAKSYEVIPLGQALFSPALVFKLVGSGGLIFDLALKVGAPVIVTLWMSSICLAILNRMIPQMNIFMIDFPVRISIGLMSLSLSLPFISNQFGFMLKALMKDLSMAFVSMRG
ncbi:MAG: flagellar biosynthetic protein FliR [Elusimicrobiota bacterium]